MFRDNSKVVALIPARGGSKGIPRKNIVNLVGKPLIEYTIKAAQFATLVDHVCVSSDDTEILTLSKNLGATTLNRPAALANDKTSANEVVYHFIDSLPEVLKKENTVIVYLQPTSPLRNWMHIDHALKAMDMANGGGVISVVEADKSPYKAFQLDKSGKLVSIFAEKMSNACRQDLPLCYYPNGAIYAFRIDSFINNKGFPSNGSIPFIMSASESVDVDSFDDLKIAAETIIKQNA